VCEEEKRFVSNVEPGFEDDDDDQEPTISPEEVLQARKELAERCKLAGITLEILEDLSDSTPHLRIGMRSGREVRWLSLWSDAAVMQFRSIKFESYIYLSGLEAICSYTDGTIEVGIRPLTGAVGSRFLFDRLLGPDRSGEQSNVERKILITPSLEGLPEIEFSRATDVFLKLCRSPTSQRMTLKLSGCAVKTHDMAIALLNKVAGAVFFQLDLLADIPMTLERERRRPPGGRGYRRSLNEAINLQYPKTEFDSAPLSLYWYGRSADNMPLLQFLAYYQVIEFYFPIYSQSEAQRKLKLILKDPVFRGDRDTDIARLLAAIHISRGGGFGDERSQLRAVVTECIDANDLRKFLESSETRKEFYTAKSKGLPYHKIPVANPTADLRNDVAERIYDIRCKIVHTKADARDASVDLLLPFSKDADQLTTDIELMQYLARLVLVAGSTPMHMHG
jgi:hypothetical protein